MKSLVIAGGGFAGVSALRTAHRLGLTHKMEVTLIGRDGVFEYLPSLPYLISGLKRPEMVTRPLEGFASRLGAKLIKDEIVGIEPTSNEIRLRTNGVLGYDYLVIGLGADVDYSNVKGYQYVYAAYRLRDYLSILKKLEELGEEWGSIIVVGGGLVGEEIAGELKRWDSSIDVILIEEAETLLPYSGSLRIGDEVKSLLEKSGVKVVTGSRCVEVTRSGVVFESGDSLETSIVVWAAGVRGQRPELTEELPTHGRGWILVDKTLRVERYDNVFAPGDVNWLQIDGDTPMKSVEEAMLQAETAVENIARSLEGRPLKPYSPLFLSSSPKILGTVGAQGFIVWGNSIRVSNLAVHIKNSLEKTVLSFLDGRSENLFSLKKAFLKSFFRVF